MKSTYRLFKEAVSSWIADNAFSMGAALAFYTMFSLAPLLFIVLIVAGFAFGDEAARGEVFAQLSGLIGADAAKGVEGMITNLNDPERGAAGTIFGSIMLLVGATTVFAELQNSLDRIWRAPAREPSGIWGLLRARLLSFGLILGIGFLIIVSLVASAALAALGQWWSPLFGGWERLAQVVNALLSFGLFTVAFAMIYKIMPRVRIAWRDVWVGAAATAVLMAIGKFAIGFYIGHSAVASTYGAAASLAVVLLWVYYSSLIFLLGAEFTWVYAHSHGSRQGESMAKDNTLAATPAGAGPNETATAGAPSRGSALNRGAGASPSNQPASATSGQLRPAGVFARAAWGVVALGYLWLDSRTRRRPSTG